MVLARFKIIFSTSGLNYLQFRVLLTFQATVSYEVFPIYILWNNIYVTEASFFHLSGHMLPHLGNMSY